MKPAVAIRSFVLRQGRMTPAQKRALQNLLPRFGLRTGAPLDPLTVFNNDRPWVLEIGFGMGHALIEMAQTNPQNNYVGVEVHGPGVGHVLIEIEKHQLQNIRVFQADINEVLETLPDRILQQVYILFPDPWPKKKQQKRRLIQPGFIHRLERKLIQHGCIFLATDDGEYAQQIREVFDSSPCFKPLPHADTIQRPQTKYERRAISLGNQVCDHGYRYHNE